MSSLTNALRVLAMFDSSHAELRVTEVAHALDLPKSSVSRLFAELAAAGMVERDAGRHGFQPGPELFRLGSLYGSHQSVEERVSRLCQKLLRRYPATAYLGVLRGADLVVLRRHESAHPLRYILEPGDTIPAHETGLGKALLARLPREDIAALLPEHLTSDSRDLNMSRTALIDELGLVLRRGYGEIADKKLMVGAIGVAVRTGPKRYLGFALSYALGSIDDNERSDLVGDLTGAAREAGRLCRDPYWETFDSA